jgi:predicted nucleic acid-binding protein
MNDFIFFDTSAVYALINIKDPDHKKVENVLKGFKGKLFVTNYVFDESITLIKARLGFDKAVSMGNILLKSPQIEKIWITPSDEKGAWEFFLSRKDKSYSFTDCTSFIVMKRLKINKCLALDEHFKQEGFEGVL